MGEIGQHPSITVVVTKLLEHRQQFLIGGVAEGWHHVNERLEASAANHTGHLTSRRDTRAPKGSTHSVFA
ncbi:hypothetical protein D3C77_437490 [compost metagenome]